jgi:anti-sigma B factor antagonist
VGADEVGEALVAERQRHHHAVGMHAAPALGQVPERQQQPVVDPLVVRQQLDAAPPEHVDGAAEQALDEAIADSAGVFLLDMTGLDFLDSSGIHALLRARALLGRADRTLALVCRQGPVRRVLELAGVWDLFACYPTRDAAACALVPANRDQPKRGSSSRDSSSKNSSCRGPICWT